MGAYTGTPTVVASYDVGDRYGKHVETRRRLSLSLSTQGGESNTISAVSLGFRAGGLISARCLLFTDGGSQKRTVELFTDGTYMYVADPIESIDADRGEPKDVTGTLVCEVNGLV